MLKFWLGLYWLVLVCYSFFSYSLTDPNLVLLDWQPYWNFQQFMWQSFFANAQLLMTTYLALVLLLFTVFIQVLRILQRSSLEYQKHPYLLILLYCLIISPLIFSYNALSHDVFNYIFNAKMLLMYDLNPHVHTALEVVGDDWTRFMHNTHTAAPYGYGWTALSLIPYFIGLQKFLLTWLAFRIWSVGSVVLLFFALQHAAQSFLQRRMRTEELAVVFLNPLFVLEIISNMHNDIWMIVPAVYALSFFWRMKGFAWGQSAVYGLCGAALLLLSISVKFATVVLLPIVLLILWEKLLLSWTVRWLEKRIPMVKLFSAGVVSWLQSWYGSFVPLAASILLFLPLLTSRSQYFHPWYLVWALAWLPLLSQRFWKLLILVFSLSSLIRYTPWLLEGGFADNTLLWQQVLTWSIPVVFVLLWFAQNSSVRTTVRSAASRII